MEGGGARGFDSREKGFFGMFPNGMVVLRAFKGGKEASELVETELQTVYRSVKKTKLRDMFRPAEGLE